MEIGFRSDIFIMKKLIMYLHPTVKIVTPLGYPAKYPFNQMVNRILPDELNPYPIKLAVEPFHEIAALPVETKTFEELSFQRALELKRNINEDIYIKYSGGIDSATALISIMRSWSSDELQRVHVIMSKDSIDEFPEMWPVLYKTFRGRLHNTHNDIRIFAEKGHVISGEMGDQLWGSSIMYQLADRYGIDTVFQPWQNIMHQYWYDFHFLGKTAAYGRGVPDEKRANLEAATLVERHSSTLKYCPFLSEQHSIGFGGSTITTSSITFCLEIFVGVILRGFITESMRSTTRRISRDGV